MNCLVELKFGVFSPTAQEIQCISPMVPDESELPIIVTVLRRRDNVTATFANSDYDSFNYVNPVVSDVSPSYGPKSGGTTIVLRGTALNIGNVASTSVKVGLFSCQIL